jgi:hypothetical protein
MSNEHQERREYNLVMAQDIGEIKAMLAGLAGPQGRVTALEKAQETSDTRFWIQTAVLIPLFGTMHAVLKKIGI